MPNNIMPRVTQALRALLCMDSGMAKLAARRSMKNVMSGSKLSSRLRQPKTLTMSTAENAKKKLMRPKPGVAHINSLELNQASSMVCDNYSSMV